MWGKAFSSPKNMSWYTFDPHHSCSDKLREMLTIKIRWCLEDLVLLFEKCQGLFLVVGLMII